jgi:biopolymer transport protein ExbD
MVIYAALLMQVLPVLMVDVDYKVPRGIPVYFAEPPKYCGDGRTVVPYIKRDGSLKMDSETLQAAELGQRVRHVFQTRFQKVILIRADPDVSYGQVIKIIDTARGEGIYSALLTPRIEDMRPCCCLGVSHPLPSPANSSH